MGNIISINGIQLWIFWNSLISSELYSMSSIIIQGVSLWPDFFLYGITTSLLNHSFKRIKLLLSLSATLFRFISLSWNHSYGFPVISGIFNIIRPIIWISSVIRWNHHNRLFQKSYYYKGSILWIFLLLRHFSFGLLTDSLLFGRIFMLRRLGEFRYITLLLLSHI